MKKEKFRLDVETGKEFVFNRFILPVGIFILFCILVFALTNNVHAQKISQLYEASSCNDSSAISFAVYDSLGNTKSFQKTEMIRMKNLAVYMKNKGYWIPTSANITNANAGSVNIAHNLNIFGVGSLGIASTSQGSLVFYNSSNNYYANIICPAISGSYSLQLPFTAGSPNQVLTTDGSGVLSWTNNGGTLPSLNSVLHSGDSTGGKSIVVSSGDSLKFKTTGVPGTHIFSIANSNAFTSNFSWKLPFAQGGVNTFLNNDGGGNLSWTSPPVASSGTYTPTYANAFNITGSVSGNLFYAITPSGADTMVRVWGYVVVNHITTTNLYSGFTFTLPIEAHNFITNCGAGFANQLQSTTFSTGTVYVNVGAKTAEVDWNSQVPVSAQDLAVNFTYMLNK